MTGKASQDQPTEVSIPAPLARFAADEHLSLRQTLTLLDMQKQIVAHRSARKKDDLDSVDWRKFYESVKEFERATDRLKKHYKHDCEKCDVTGDVQEVLALAQLITEPAFAELVVAGARFKPCSPTTPRLVEFRPPATPAPAE